MKKKNTVLLLGLTSILIVIAVQVFIITGVWKQRNEMFSLRYTMRSQEALRYIWRSLSTNGFDTVDILLDDYSTKIADDLFRTKSNDSLNIKKKEILNYVTAVINNEQDLSSLLSRYFEMRGLEKNFRSDILINDLEIINEDTITIYRNENFFDRNQEKIKKTSPGSISGSEIFINTYGFERDHYRLNISYFIDFSDKKKLILRETSATLGLSVLSILVVGIMFMITYRNLREERRLSNLKTDFINNMTHELKTPLSTITVAGKTLEMPQIRQNDEKILETAKLIGKQSVHLNQLINMILEISMWERTQFQLDKKKVDVEDLLKDVVAGFRSGGGNGASIREKYNLTGVTADIDVVYFTTLLNNLLSNAVKYSDKAPEIDIEGFTTNDNNICIKVSDNGIGINKMDQKHIFDKFYRASTGNIHKFKGLGLGLYYVKKIAEAHGGDVTVNSKPGKGSMFTVILPGDNDSDLNSI
jgi:two-component system phosphate regulon sensor histidine kinase PhoR